MLNRVSAVIVTRGDHPNGVRRIVDSLPFDDIVVLDNSQEQYDRKVFGRYMGMTRAKNTIIYVQDDDCIVSEETIKKLLKEYEPGKVTLAMPEDHGEYTDSGLVGWGAIFDRYLPWESFARYGERWDIEHFYDTCDVIFTALTPIKRIVGEHDNFDYAYGEDRMYNQEYHDGMRREILNRARIVRDNG